MSFNWSLFIQVIESDGVPNFTPDGHRVWDHMNAVLEGTFQHRYTTLPHTAKIKLLRELFQHCFKALSASEDWKS